MTDIKQAALDLLTKNRRMKDGFQYTVPSPTSYPYQWLWDSCFHAIILSEFNTEDAKKELISLFSAQFESGLIPHMIYWDRQPGIIDVEWGKDKTSSITQPPMIAYAVYTIFKKDGDKEFVKKVYPNLYHYYNFLLTERDPRRNHLIGIINPDESGEDNSPRFDIPLGLPPKHTQDENFKKRMEFIEKNRSCNFDAPFCMKNFFWSKDVPFNAIMVENLRILSKLAREIGYIEDSLHYEEQSVQIAKAMRERMEENGLFWSTYGMSYKKLKVKTWAIFSPLFAEILSKEEAATLVKEHLNNEMEFRTPFSVPTVSRDEGSYDPTGFWRGPVWIATNWFIYKGLKRYGFEEEAARIKEQSILLVRDSGFREQFNPETGEGLGAKEFTWGALVLDM
jgi:glycogen debranching enzyme